MYVCSAYACFNTELKSSFLCLIFVADLTSQLHWTETQRKCSSFIQVGGLLNTAMGVLNFVLYMRYHL